MSVRGFDGVNDVIRLAAPPFFNGAHSIVAVVKRAAASAYHGIFAIGSSIPDPELVLEFRDDGGIEYLAPSAGFLSSKDWSHPWGSTAWRLVAVTHPGGNTIPRFHAFDGSLWFHGNGNQPLNTSGWTNWVTSGGAEIRLGNYDSSFNFFAGSMAVQALWVGTALTDGALEALAGGGKGDWATAGAAHLWELNQDTTTDPVSDYVGTLGQTALTGTSIIADTPPGSIYNFAADPSTPPANTTAPAITGSAVRGSPVTCSPGSWTGSPPLTYSYQWKRAGANIATGATYTLRTADVGQPVWCEVTALNAHGTDVAVSDTITPVEAPPPAGRVALGDVLEDITAALVPISDEIPDLTVYPYWSDVPTPPALDVYPGSPFQTAAGYGAGNNQVFFTVRARVAMHDPVAGQQLLLRLLDPADPANVEQALQNVVTVTEGGVSGFTQYADDAPANERMLGCEWRITTYI